MAALPARSGRMHNRNSGKARNPERSKVRTPVRPCASIAATRRASCAGLAETRCFVTSYGTGYGTSVLDTTVSNVLLCVMLFLRYSFKVAFVLGLALMSSPLLALPHYFIETTTSEGFLAGGMILNKSRTGASVFLFGVLDVGIPPSSAFVEGVGLPKLPGGDPSAFSYQGTIYIPGCCGSVSVGGVTGFWTFDFDPEVDPNPSGGVSQTDYSDLADPPPDIPEPSTFALLGSGAAVILVSRWRIRARSRRSKF